FIIFFFQAEDGIRDFHVTGVQTCALPISDTQTTTIRAAIHQRINARVIRNGPGPRIASSLENEGSWDLCSVQPPSIIRCLTSSRSEERRVGNECRSRERHGDS